MSDTAGTDAGAPIENDRAARAAEQASASTSIRTPDQRLRVFVSSTLLELAPERVAARAAITKLRLIPVLFELGARPHPPRDLYRAYLEQSHIFIGIYWERYGWMAPEMDISGLEDEYRLSGQRPKLIYIKEPSPAREPRLTTLLDQIRNEDMVSYKPFADAAELQDLIENDLALLLTERFESAHKDNVAVSGEAARRPSNLPVPPTPLIGRVEETAEVRELVLREDVRCVTLTGPGGIGKSRLALHVASEVEDRFEDGVCFVDLTAIRDPSLVAASIAEARSIHIVAGRPIMELLKNEVRDKRLLLLLDNFEQVLDAAPLVADLLAVAPHLNFLITSRAVLRLRVEYEYPVPPLGLPDPNELPALDQMDRYEAVRLFVERARATKLDFAVTSANAPAIAEICRRLDGLPLAIELAAARVKHLPPQAILARLSRSLDVLSGGLRDLPDRHQTLTKTIEWSYKLLPSLEQRLFDRIGVFAGSFTLEAAEAVCDPDGELQVLDSLSSLVDKSLVRQRSDSDDEIRYMLFETIREYASTSLTSSGEAETVRSRHGAYYLDLAEQAAPELRGSQQTLWMRRLKTEHDNLRAALQWFLDQGEAETVVRPGWALSIFWCLDGHPGEGQRWMEEALTSGKVVSDAFREKALSIIGTMAYLQGSYERAVPALVESLAFYPATQNKLVRAYTLLAAGFATMMLRQYDWATTLFEESLQFLAELGEEWGAAVVKSALGRLALERGDLDGAIEQLEAVLARGRQLEHTLTTSWALANLGHAMLYKHDYQRAQHLLEEGLAMSTTTGDQLNLAECMEGLANLAIVHGQFDRGARLFGAAEALREAIGVARSPYLHSYSERSAVQAAIQLGERAPAVWAEGRAMRPAKAVALALEHAPTKDGTPAMEGPGGNNALPFPPAPTT
ncbi:MAG TPA: DUF4062 domain-containing protein [Herpetosiphonaceae bacterium]|nr:DUF4062 domain-containing protein [Herpetosiphonaceae bacterium]